MKFKKTILFSIITTTISPAVSFSMFVIDPSNLVQNTHTAMQTFQMARDTTQSLENLKNMYHRIDELRDIDLLNLEQLSNLGTLIQSTDNSIDDNYGMIASQLAVLDPTKSDYAEKRDDVLANYYEKPTDPNEIQATFKGEMNQEQIDAMKVEAKRQQRDYQIVQRAADDGANEQRIAKKRQVSINKHGDTIKHLGEKSELKTQQVIASEVNLQLQQNEQLIQQQNESLMNAKMQKADEASEKAKETKYEQERLKKSINQGTSGLGRANWGDL
ncbi:MAG: hypothetical protein ABI370_12210 [Gammaproteobacteria bacterium]